MKIAVAVFLGEISYAEAIQLTGQVKFDENSYDSFIASSDPTSEKTKIALPPYWHDMVSDHFYAASLEEEYSH